MFIVIVRNNSNSQAIDASLLLLTYFQSQSIGCAIIDSQSLGNDAQRDKVRDQLPDQVDLVVVLGGDGTILHSAHLVESRSIPILGINYGNLGFLANPNTDGVVEILSAALSGEVVEDRRTTLDIEVVCEGEQDRYEDDGDRLVDMEEIDASLLDIAAASAGSPKVASPYSAATLLEGHTPSRDVYGVNVDALSGRRRFFALNEIAVTRGAMGRIIDFTLDISGSRIAAMRGDGLIVATATGSTAYTLSAGGPLVSPGYGGLIVTPLAPHSLRTRSIVTAEHDVVEMTLQDDSSYREATLFVDGEMLLFDNSVRRIYVRRSPHPITLLRYRDTGYYRHVSEVFF